MEGAPADGGDAVGGDAQAAAGEDGQVPPPAEVLTPDVVERLVQERLAQFQAQAQPPAYLQQLLENQQRQTEAFNSMLQQAQQAQYRQQLEASRPKPPPPGAPVEDLLDFQRRDFAWQQQQSIGRLEHQFRTYTQQLESKLQAQAQAMQQASIQAQRATYEAQMNAQLGELTKKPEFTWARKPEAQAVVRTIHQVLTEANPNVTLAETARLLGNAFGQGAPSPAAQNAARRGAETDVLKAQRAAVQQRRGPVPSAQASRGNGSPPKDRVAAVRKAMAHGARFPPELLEAYGLTNNNQ